MIDWQKPPFWRQVETYNESDFRKLSEHDRLLLTRKIKEEFLDNNHPRTSERAQVYMQTSRILPTLFRINSEMEITSPEDQERRNKISELLGSAPGLKNMDERWASMDAAEKSDVLEEIKEVFAEIYDLDMSEVPVRFGSSDMLMGDADDQNNRLIISRYENTSSHFTASVYALTLACARYRHNLILNGDSPENEKMKRALQADMDLSKSMFWDVNHFRDYLNQASLRDAKATADQVYRSMASTLGYSTTRRAENLKNAKLELESRFLTEKIAHTTHLPINGLEETEHALEFMSPEQIDMLALRAQKGLAALVKRTYGREGEVPPKLHDCMRKILEHLPLTPEYQQHQRLKQKELIAALNADPIIQNAKKMSWHLTGESRRLEVMQRAADIHARVYGYSSCTVAVFDADKTDGKNVQGQYSWGTQRVDIDRGCLNGSFSSVLNTLVHECTHAYQDHLGEAFENFEIDRENPVFQQGEIFMMGRALYLAADIHDEYYRNNPLEIDAFNQGDEVADIITSSPEGQKQQIAKIDAEILAYQKRMRDIVAHKRLNSESDDRPDPYTLDI